MDDVIFRDGSDEMICKAARVVESSREPEARS